MTHIVGAAIAALISVLPVQVGAAEKARELTVDETKKIVISSPMPRYPVGARSAGMRGSGLFRLHVRQETGEVTKVEVRKSTGHKALDDAATSAFRRWRFRPAIGLEGANIPVTFIF